MTRFLFCIRFLEKTGHFKYAAENIEKLFKKTYALFLNCNGMLKNSAMLKRIVLKIA